MADITYVRLNGRFIYVCLLMLSVADQSALDPISDAQTGEALCHSVPEIHHSDQGVHFSKAIATLFRRTAGTTLGERIC